MAIRNNILGGEDFVKGERLRYNDLNDTFDEIKRLVDNGNT